MKTILAIAAISTGLIWGCQAKPENNTAQEANMNHEMKAGMNQNMDHDHSKMSGDMDHKAMEKGENIAYYTCPMESHKYIHSDEPGSCPECGMALVAVTEVSPEQADYYGCPMPAHSNVRSDEPGQCPECGMDLKPYKLEKTG